MLTKSVEDIEYDAKRICSDLKQFYHVDCEVKKSFTQAGGSILPDVKLPTYQVILKHKTIDSCTLFKNLLSHGVVPLMKEDKILFDPRCLLERDYARLCMAFEQVFRKS